ncbi:MAG: DbpA RNA binding domain-containing protein [Spirochaetota bacterium]|jgi:ATP-dependent RNA helicase DeaD
MNQLKKIEKILESALHEDLTPYFALVKAMRKHLPLFGSTKRITAALLKESIGDISKLDIAEVAALNFTKTSDGTIVFEDIKDGKARIFINIGKNHKITPGDLIREISKRSGIDGKLVGKIDIHSTYSFIEIPEQYAELVLVSLDKARIKGVPIVVEPAKKKKKQ